MSKLRKLKEARSEKLKDLQTLKTDGEARDLNAEEEKRFADLCNDIEDLNAKIAAEERAEDLLKSAVTVTAAKANFDTKDEAYRHAYRSFLSHGQMAPAEERALIEQRAALSGVAGSALIPQEMADRVEVALKAYGGMFEAAEVIYTTTGAELILPTVDDTSRKAAIIAEYAESSTDKPVFSSVSLNAYTYRTPDVPISYELIQDSNYDIESLIVSLLTESFSRGTNDDFTNGAGTSGPKGILTSASVGVTLEEPEVTYDNLIALMGSVDTAYAQKGKFMLNSHTLLTIMSIKDDNNRPIIENSIVSGVPPMILGKQYILNEDMPDIGYGNKPITFGDHTKYKIRVVKGFASKRLEEKYSSWLSIGWFGYGRADGILVDAGTHPVKCLAIDEESAS